MISTWCSAFCVYNRCINRVEWCFIDLCPIYGSPLCPRSHLWARLSEPRGFVSLPTHPPVWPKLRRIRRRILLEAVDGCTRRTLGYLAILVSDPYRPVHTLQDRLENHSVGTRPHHQTPVLVLLKPLSSDNGGDRRTAGRSTARCTSGP